MTEFERIEVDVYIRELETAAAQLTERVTTLEAALLPFARYARYMAPRWTAADDSAYYGVKRDTRYNVTYGAFRRAVRAMFGRSENEKANADIVQDR